MQKNTMAISSGNGPCSTVARLPQVGDQMEALDSALHRLSELADRLECKLSPALRQEDCGCSAGAPDDCLVPLADSIRSFKRRVQNVSEQLDSIFLRLEL